MGVSLTRNSTLGGPSPAEEVAFYASGRKFKGSGNPNGRVPGRVGDEFLDTDTSQEWHKTSNELEKTGWVLEDDSSDFGDPSFDASNDGVTNDLVPLQEAAAAMQSGQTLELGNNLLLSIPTAAGVAATFDNLHNITIRGRIVNNDFELNTTGVYPGSAIAIWRPISSMTSVGATVTVTTSAQHGIASPMTVLIYVADATHKRYTGSVLVTPTGSNTFTYSTVSGETPAGPASGVMYWAYPDYDRTFFRFTRCSGVTLDLEFVGAYRPQVINHRLGYRVLDFQQASGVDNVDFNIRLKCTGASYGISAGSFRSTEIGHLLASRINLFAYRTGYGVAFWGRGGSQSNLFINASECHRGAYLAGPRDLEAEVRVKDFDISGCLITTHKAGSGIHHGAENVRVKVSDTGTTLGISYGDVLQRGLLFLATDIVAGSTWMRNINAEVSLITDDTVGKNITAFLMDADTQDVTYEKISLTGSIDRTGVTTTTGVFASYETFIRTLINQEVRNLALLNFVVRNSAQTLTSLFRRQIEIANLTGPYVQFNSPTNSHQTLITITTGVGGSIHNYDSPDVSYGNGAFSGSLASATLTTGAATFGDGSNVLPAIHGTTNLTTGFSFPASGNIWLLFAGAIKWIIASTTIFPKDDVTSDIGGVGASIRDIYYRGSKKVRVTQNYGVTTTVDFAATTGDVRELTMSGDTTFATSNVQADRHITIFINPGASIRNITWPAWIPIGAALPATFAANKKVKLDLFSLGTTDASIWAQVSAQP